MRGFSTCDSRRSRAMPFFMILFGFTGGLKTLVLRGEDCNRNGVPDAEDIASRTSRDCNQNGLPDECEPIFPPHQENDRVPVGTAPRAVVASDLNGDGKIDAATVNWGSNDIAIFLNDAVAQECGGQLPGDGNQDGKLDLSDAVWLLSHLFLSTAETLPCEGGMPRIQGPASLRSSM